MIDIHIEKQYKDFKIKISYASAEIGVTAILGRSGAGKTSVINMIAGLSQPDKGHIRLDGKTVFDSDKSINIATEKRRFGYIFQDGRLFPHLSVMSNLTYGMKLIPASERYLEINQIIDLLDLSGVIHRRPAKLSGGEKQRVAMGRALLTSPSLLLMDEPLASLDEARKNEVLPFIKKLSADLAIPVLYVSHSMEEIQSIAQRIMVLDKGVLKFAGRTEQTMQHEDFSQIAGAISVKKK